MSRIVLTCYFAPSTNNHPIALFAPLPTLPGKVCLFREDLRGVCHGTQAKSEATRSLCSISKWERNSLGMTHHTFMGLTLYNT